LTLDRIFSTIELRNTNKKGKGDKMADTRYSEYHNALDNDAEEFVDNYYDDFLDEIKGGYATRHFFDSFIDDDGKLHSHIDEYLSLHEAVDIIENCDNEETDSGLWEGMSPKEAIIAMAFWSYRLDIMEKVKELFKDKLTDELIEQEGVLDTLYSELDELKDKLEKVDEESEEYPTLEESVENQENKVEAVEDYIKELNAVIDDM
jgi:predicted RNase H-like nuclease (RuvC/YqgF family)